VNIGQPAPDFSLPAEDSSCFRLAEQLGTPQLLVFYPMDDSPVCTAQLCDYRDGIEQFADLGIDVVGISPDSPESHQAFRERHKLPFPLLSDPDYEAARLYGCKGVLGMKRGVFLVDGAGTLRYRNVLAVAMFRQTRDEILEALEELGLEQSS
jgi:peroxiredoxin Q/BCP